MDGRGEDHHLGRFPLCIGRIRTLCGGKYIRNAVREIMGFGYQPVIAHVERYRNLMERKFAAIQWMREIGALIQVNCASVTGDNGFTTNRM